MKDYAAVLKRIRAANKFEYPEDHRPLYQRLANSASNLMKAEPKSMEWLAAFEMLRHEILEVKAIEADVLKLGRAVLKGEKSG